jgi:hypothetical protein
MSSPNPENRRSKAEAEHLSKLEAIVQRGVDADVDVGNALAEIRDTALYHASHHTFEAYLRDRWGMSLQAGEQLIEAAEAAIPPPAGADNRLPAARPPSGMPAPVRPDAGDLLARIWEQTRQEFSGDDVIAVDIQLTVHRREQPRLVTPRHWSGLQGRAGSPPGDLLRQLRWLMTESSGTLANVAHHLETRAAELGDDAWDQLRDDVLVLDEDIAALKALLIPSVDWDAEQGRLIAGEVPPFEDDPADEDEYDEDEDEDEYEDE